MHLKSRPALAERHCESDTPRIIAAPVGDEPTVFRLLEVRGSLSHAGVTVTRLDNESIQCPSGGATTTLGNVWPFVSNGFR